MSGFGAERKHGFDYPALAQDAFMTIVNKVNAGKATTLVGIRHQNPVTNRPCQGTFVSEYPSWPDALRSESMAETGGVTAICALCGAIEFIDESRKLIKQASDSGLKNSLTS
jgi:hypothetical protein